MIWIEGSVLYGIEEAVREGALLLVFIDGEDDESFKLRGVFDAPVVNFLMVVIRCVPVRVALGTVTYQKFARYFSVNKAPALYFITPKGDVTATIEGYVPPDELADRIAPLMNWAVRQQRYRSPVTVICEDTAERLTRASATHSSGYILSVNQNNLTPERKFDSRVPIKTSAGSCIFHGGKRPLHYSCKENLDDTQASRRTNKFVLSTDCGYKGDCEVKKNGSSDRSVYDETLCVQAAAFFARKFADKALSGSKNTKPLSSDDSIEATMPRMARIRTTLKAQQPEDPKIPPASTSIHHLCEPAEQVPERYPPTPWNGGKEGALSFPLFTSIRREVVSEPKGNFGSARMSGHDAYGKTARAEEAHAVRHEVGDRLSLGWTSMKSQDELPPKDVLTDEQPGRPRRSTINASRNKPRRVPAFHNVPYSCVDLASHGSLSEGGHSQRTSATVGYERNERPMPAEKIRIVFLLPDGTYFNRSFPSTTYLGDVRWDLEEMLDPEYRYYFPFAFARTQTYTEFTPKEYRTSIGDLKLGPSVTLLVYTIHPSSNDYPFTTGDDMGPVPSRWSSVLPTIYEFILKAPLLYLWNLIIDPFGACAAVPPRQ